LSTKDEKLGVGKTIRLHDKLPQKVDVLVLPPCFVPIEFSDKVRTNRRDSRKTAKLLEDNLLKRVYVFKEEDRVNRNS
jgi:hypothetical protein